MNLSTALKFAFMTALTAILAYSVLVLSPGISVLGSNSTSYLGPASELNDTAFLNVTSALNGAVLASDGVQASVRDARAYAPEGQELEEIISDFENYTEKSMREWLVPGLAVAVVRGDQVIYLHCFGNKTASGGDPVTPGTIFQIGSNSKAFTAALVAMMVDDGLIGWDDRVVDHLSDFRMYDPWVTREFRVKDLLTHNSGLPAMAGDDLITLGYGPEKEMQALGQIEPATSFRSSYSYDNILFLWAAKLVEAKTGKTWEECLSQRIFLPLDMKNTSSGLSAFLEAKDAAGWHKLKDNEISSGKIVTLPRDWKYRDWVYGVGPAGGINSNIFDMAKWLTLHTNGSINGKNILGQDNLDLMHSPLILASNEQKLFGGMGWLYEEYSPDPIVWHNGGTFGHHSMVALIPESKLGIVVLSDSFVGLPDLLAYWFFDRYFENPQRDYSAESKAECLNIEELRKAYAIKPPVPSDPSLPLDRYAGNYSNEIYGLMNITVRDERLVATMGPRGLEAFFSHWNRDSFLANVPEFMNMTSSAVFNVGPDGKAESVSMLLFIEGEKGSKAEFKRCAA